MRAIAIKICLCILQITLCCGPLFFHTWRGWWSKIVTRISRWCAKHDNLHFYTQWRSLFSVLPLLGGVDIFNICNTSAAKCYFCSMNSRRCFGTMPVHTATPFVLRPFAFPHLEGVVVNIVTRISRGVCKT